MQYMRRHGIEFAEMDQEVLLYDPANVKFCALNQTAGFVWDRLAVAQSFETLLDDVTRAYVVSPGSAEHDLRGMLRQLTELAFIESVDAPLTAHQTASSAAEPRAYQAPSVRQMDEMEVLSEFQVTSAGISWWSM